MSAIDTLDPRQQSLYQDVVLEGLAGNGSFLAALHRRRGTATRADLEAVRAALLADARALGGPPPERRSA